MTKYSVITNRLSITMAGLIIDSAPISQPYQQLFLWGFATLLSPVQSVLTTVGMLKSLREALRMSLYHFFWPPWSVFPLFCMSPFYQKLWASTGNQEVVGSISAASGNILLWRWIMKYFLQFFHPFHWFKKDSCQFLFKECAQVLVNP